MLSAGQQVDLGVWGARATVGRLLGEGGEGWVHEVAVDASGQTERYALKWYRAQSATVERRAALRALIHRGAPDRRFLWPFDLATTPGRPGFGYVMPLRGPNFRGLVDLLRGRIDTGFQQLATFGLQLSDSFKLLHSHGLCYRDISFGNVFFDPDTGDACICDNDNVGITGASKALVLGTPGFMAPEVVRREAVPSTKTDLYSLAVLLFYIFMAGHPLDGMRALSYEIFDERAQFEVYGADPRFIFDPDDQSNAPDPDFHSAPLTFWPLYPPFLRKLFTTSFTVGLASPDARVPEGTWRVALARLRDTIMACAQCEAKNFLHAKDQPQCWSCGADPGRPATLHFRAHPLVLTPETVVYRHHLHHDWNFTDAVARVERHPREAGRWGLRNVGDREWTVTGRRGNVHRVPPGRAIGLNDGLELDFGPAQATVRGTAARPKH